MDLKDIRCFPVFVSSEIHQPINKNTFLIGDAFFAFPPTFAQGASQSIEVAHELYKNLKDVRCFPVFVSSEIHQPINKNTFLIGDAFFAFPPTFAQGASQSIEVAHELYKNLENEDNQFNVERIERTKMIDWKSKFNYFAFHLSNPFLIWIRNTLMKYLVRNSKFINNYLGKIYKN